MSIPSYIEDTRFIGTDIFPEQLTTDIIAEQSHHLCRNYTAQLTISNISLSMNANKRVIYVLPTTDVAGGVRIVFEHANRLRAHGFHAEVYSLQESPKWVHHEVPVRTFRDYQELGHELEEQVANKVATFWATAPIVAQHSRDGEGYYLVQDIESWFYPNDNESQRSVLATYELPLTLLSESKWVHYQLSLLRKTGLYIGIGIEHSVFRRPESLLRRPNRVVVNAPREDILWYLKGMDVLSLALERAAVRIPGLEVISFSSSVNPLIIPGLEVTHITRPSDKLVARLYASASCFVVASRHEGFCLPAVEAMACECAVVATRAGGNEEFCLNEETSLLVDSEDSHGLAASIERVLRDNVLANRLREGGLYVSKSYTWDSVIPNLVNALRLG